MMRRLNYMYNDIDMFYIYVYVRAGSINEPPEIQGISHLLEHMLLKHSKHYTEEHMLKELTEIGAVYNAATDKDFTYYYQVTHISNYTKSIDIISDVIKFPVFTEEELNIERKVVIEEIKKRFDENGHRYNDSISTLLSKENPYVLPVEGTVKSLKNITVRDLKSYFDEHYKDYIVCINCDRKYKHKVHEYVNKKFPNDDIQFPTFSIPTSIQCSVHVIYENNKQYITYLRFLSFPEAMYKENIYLKFVNYVLFNSGLFSKIVYQLRSKQGLIYNASAFLDAFRYFGSNTLTFSTSQKDTVFVLKTVLDIITNIKNEGLSKQDMAFYKTSFLNKHYYVFTDEGFKTQFFNKSVFYGHNLTKEIYSSLVKHMTNEDLIDITKKAFDFKKMGVLTIGRYTNITGLKDDLIQLIQTQ